MLQIWDIHFKVAELQLEDLRSLSKFTQLIQLTLNCSLSLIAV